MKLKTKIILCILFNLLLYVTLYNIPIESEILNNICLIKLITGKKCWNCGMTRAFLSLLHLDIYSAYQYNRNVFFVFPMTIGVYIYSCYKYIMKGDVNNERKR